MNKSYINIFKSFSSLNTGIQNYNKDHDDNKLITCVNQVATTLIKNIGYVYSDLPSGSQKKSFNECEDDDDMSSPSCMIKNCLLYLQTKINGGILDNVKFIKELYRLLWEGLIKPTSLRMRNISTMIPFIVDSINKITRENYMIASCNPTTMGLGGNNVSEYVCGRAMYYNEDPIKNTKLIIFNTISDFDDDMDTSYFTSSILESLKGGSNMENYFSKKYTKYVKKIQKLKFQ